MENNMLRVQLDLAEGVYVISRNDGEEVIKLIKDGTKSHYDKAAMDKRRKEIEKLEAGQSKWIPEDLLKTVDPVLYDALEEFDSKYGTQYRSAYVKAITLQIPYTGVSEMKKKRQYEKRAAGIRTEKLEKAGISMEYDLNIFGGLGLKNNLQALKIARAQKTVGVTIKNRQTDFVKNIGAAISTRVSSIRDKIIEQRIRKNEEKIKLAQKKVEASVPRDEHGLIDDVPELSEEELLSISSGMLEQSGQVLNIGNNAKLEPERKVGESVVIDKDVTTDENIATVGVAAGSNPQVLDATILRTNPSIKDSVMVGANSSTAQAGAEIVRTEMEAQSNTLEIGVNVEVAAIERASAGPKAKKNMSRSKSIQASKQAAREAGKLKNSYQARIQAKADARIAAAEGKQKAAIKRAEDAQKAAQEEQDRIAREREEQIRAEIEAEEARIAAEEARIAAEKALNDKKLSVRLSRKLKSVQDSIKNKVHMPDMSEYKRKITGAVTIAVERAKEVKKEAAVKFTRTLRNAQDSIKNKVHVPNLTGPQRTIAGVVAAVALVGAIGLGVAATQANADASSRIPVTPTAPIAEAVESIKPELGDIDKFVNIGDLGHKTNTIGAQETGEKTPEVKPEKSKEEQQKEYLSSIKVGSKMKIESGKYFASPDGTGNYGHFENYTDRVKEITIIDVITRDGVIVVKDPNVSLYELKQQYPEAKFSYHFVFRHSDGRTTTLGWLTENSMEQNIEIDNPQQIDEGR